MDRPPLSLRNRRSHYTSGLPWIAVAALVLAAGLSVCQPTVASAQTAVATRPALWISRAELANLPTSGSAWTKLVGEANSSWGTPNLSDNNASHDTSTLAGALVAVRTGNIFLAMKTRAAIMGATRVTSYARVLELSRNITSYVIAADLVGLSIANQTVFKSFISGLRTKRLDGHSGGYDMLTTALWSPNNWGAMARAAVTAIDLYLGDRFQLSSVAAAHRAWLGEAVPNRLKWSSTRWHAAGTPTGINRRGAVVMGRNVDGVEPEDQRRTGEPSTSPAPRGSYPWEALQGALVTGVLLQRAGIVSIHAGDRALVRAFVWLYMVNQNPASGDDTWQPWVLNRQAGVRFPTTASGSPGKNMGWSDWTHGPVAT